MPVAPASVIAWGRYHHHRGGFDINRAGRVNSDRRADRGDDATGQQGGQAGGRHQGGKTFVIHAKLLCVQVFSTPGDGTRPDVPCANPGNAM
jgi:hypothetical protein